MQNEPITIKQCRDLRKLSYEFTKDCLLVQSEYDSIMKIFLNAYERIEKLEQKINEGKYNYDINRRSK